MQQHTAPHLPAAAPQIYPVKLSQQAVYVDVTNSSSAKRERGGANTSLENNNVFTVQPTVYFEGMDPRWVLRGAPVRHPLRCLLREQVLPLFAGPWRGPCWCCGSLHMQMWCNCARHGCVACLLPGP